MDLYLVFALYFSALLFFSFRRGKEFTSKNLFLIQVFFPNWRFFENVHPSIVLFVRPESKITDQHAWIRAIPQSKRSFRSLLFNPVGNFSHFTNTLVTDFTAIAMTDMKISDLEKTSEYQKLVIFCRSYLKNQNIKTEWFQFKICSEEPDSQASTKTSDLIISKRLRSSFS